MRLYLSSFRLGNHPEELRALAGDGARRAAVIANAIDDRPEDLRRDGVQLELAALAGLGFEPHSGFPGHPETGACELVAERYRADGTPFLALSDGQALVINGASCRVV